MFEESSNGYKIGYDDAIVDVVEVLTPIVTSFDTYRESGSVMDVLRDIEGLVDEINILHGRNKL